VNEDAPLCPNFLKGFCPKGSDCKLRHSKDCPHFKRTGHCADQIRGKCRLEHRSHATEKKPDASASPAAESSTEETSPHSSALDFSHLTPSFLRTSHETIADEESDEEHSCTNDDEEGLDSDEDASEEEYSEDELLLSPPFSPPLILDSTDDGRPLRLSNDRRSTSSNDSDSSEAADEPEESDSDLSQDLPIPRFLLS